MGGCRDGPVVGGLGADARLSVSTRRDGELPSPVARVVQVGVPLDAEALEDLRWYLKDHLHYSELRSNAM